MLQRSKTERGLWPVSIIATRSGRPARTKFRTAVRRELCGCDLGSQQPCRPPLTRDGIDRTGFPRHRTPDRTGRESRALVTRARPPRGARFPRAHGFAISIKRFYPACKATCVAGEPAARSARLPALAVRNLVRGYCGACSNADDRAQDALRVERYNILGGPTWRTPRASSKRPMLRHLRPRRVRQRCVSSNRTARG
jgi:hypothetical protein